jgi:hypothetical protein
MRLRRSYRLEILLIVVLVGIAIAILRWGTLDSLDAQLYYSRKAAQAFLDGLDTDRRAVYFRTEAMDLCFLTTYSLLACRFAWRVFPGRMLPAASSLVPGLLDLVETLTIRSLLAGGRGARVPPWLGTVTALKWATGAVVLLGLLVVGLIPRARKAIAAPG